jgi:hypothetical protein
MNWKLTKPECCVVVLIIVVLSLLAYPAFCINRKISLATSTSVAVRDLWVACKAYKTEYGKYPETSENIPLVKILKSENPRHLVFIEFMKRDLNANGEAIDAWGIPLRFSFSEAEGVRVWSAGKDHLFGTKDDITSW